MKAVFNFDDTREAYASIQQAPSYRHDLDFVILAPDGSVASFCIAWVDPVISVSEFEPVGTMADYRRLGLGKAILAEAHRSLNARGIRTSGVESWSESPAATALYESAGLAEQYKIFSWSKE